MGSSRYIPFPEKVACLLVELLPNDLQRKLYDEKADAQVILSMFEWDHYPKRHVDGGPNKWWNIRPLSPEDHKEKTRKDKGELAKTDRLHGKTKTGPKKKIRSRGFMPKEEARKLRAKLKDRLQSSQK